VDPKVAAQKAPAFAQSLPGLSDAQLSAIHENGATAKMTPEQLSLYKAEVQRRIAARSMARPPDAAASKAAPAPAPTPQVKPAQKKPEVPTSY
jgi:hypothetical protein